MTWRFMLQPRYGPLNTLIVNLGGPEVSWLGNPITAYIAIIIQDVWRMWPFMFMLLYAGLTAIPQELMEAAQIDGAGFWRKLRSLTIPLLSPTILTAVLLRIIDALLCLQRSIRDDGRVARASATMLFSLYTQRQAFGYQKSAWRALWRSSFSYSLSCLR